MAQQNRYPEAIVAASATMARLAETTAYPLAVGEMVFTSDTFQLYVAANLNAGSAGSFRRVPTCDAEGRLSLGLNTALTTSQDFALTLDHNTSGTAAAGFGTAIRGRLESANGTLRDAFQLDWAWVVATDGSRTVRSTWAVNDANGLREGVRIESDGAAARLGFYGVTVVARQAAAAEATDAASTQTLANDLRSKLISLGLLS